MKHIAAYAKYYDYAKPALFLSLALSLAQVVTVVPVAFLMQQVFDRALPTRDMSLLFWCLFIAAILFFLNGLLAILNRKLSLVVIKKTIAQIRRELVEKIISMEKYRYVSEDIQVLHSKVVHDTERIDWMTSALLIQFLPGVLVVGALLCVLAYLNAQLFLVMLCIIPVCYIAGRLLGIKVKQAVKNFHGDFSRFSEGLWFTLKFNELIRVSTAEAFEFSKQDANIRNLQASSQRTAWLSTTYSVLQNNLLTLSGIIVLLIGGLQVIYGVNTVGALLSFYVALNLAGFYAANIINAMPAIVEGKESLYTVMPLLGTTKSEGPNYQTNKSFGTSITFKEVGFNYKDSNFSLTNLQFTINKGDRFGILGKSGSGKSTIVNLLMGLYQPDTGIILIDGVDLQGFHPTTWRKNIGVLPQDVIFFSGSIFENLTYGLGEVSMEMVEKVCGYCEIHDHITSLPEGYHSQMGDQGVMFSGGQKQRLGIARALLRNPEVLILDEPDNNLPESMIQQILANIHHIPITIIIITHNKNLAPHFTNTYYLP